jgi:hypothetical protein
VSQRNGWLGAGDVLVLGEWDRATRSMMNGIILKSRVTKLQERAVILTRLALRPRHRKSAPEGVSEDESRLVGTARAI